MNRTLTRVFVAQAIAMVALLTLALDQYVHAQTETIDGLNRWGYRGAVARQRAYDERRIVMIGGTRAFEPGVPVKDTTIARVRYMVEQWVTFDRGPVRAVNLGLVDLPRSAYAARLQQFRYLLPDVICVYPDLAPASAPPVPGFAMRAAGYVPALWPLTAIDHQLGRWLGPATTVTDDPAALTDAVALARSLAPTVVAVPEPHSTEETREAADLLAALSPFAGDPAVTVVRLKDGPPALVTGISQTAIAIQIEAAVSAFFRARMAPAGKS